MTIKHVQGYFRAICVVILLLLAVRWARRPKPVSYGATVELTHPCRPEENTHVSNARDIQMQYLPNGKVLINDAAFQAEEARVKVHEIMENRGTQQVWVFGDPSISYGEIGGYLAEMMHDNPQLHIFLETPEASQAADAARVPLCSPDGTNQGAKRAPLMK